MKKFIFLTPFLAVVMIAWQKSSIDKPTMERGKKVYTQHCVSCHQPDGGGVPGLNPPLEKTSWVSGSKTRLITIVLKGLNTHQDIDGEEYSNTMAPLPYLTDQQISDVLTFVRNSFGNKASAITPGDVKYVRSRTR